MNKFFEKMEGKGIEPDTAKCRFYHLPIIAIFLVVWVVATIIDKISMVLIIASLWFFTTFIPMRPADHSTDEE